MEFEEEFDLLVDESGVGVERGEGDGVDGDSGAVLAEAGEGV